MRKTIKNLLKIYRISPSKRLGQNFLISRSVLKKIVEAAEISRKDTVLEIGPGMGNLTFELAKRAKPARNASHSDAGGKVIAIEKDKKMVDILKENLKEVKNVEIIHGDILKLDPKFYPLKAYKIVANIPYYLTSRLIRKFLEIRNRPKLMVLMVQKEVAQRICAKPPKMNLLAVSVQFYAKPKIISFVSKRSFWPQPKVNSAIIRIAISSKREETRVKKDLFFKIVKAGFSHPRKQLINNLSEDLRIEKKTIKKWFLKNGIKPEQRAETLSLDRWIKLLKSYKM
ncbi:hypothetical protein AMJ49_00300 [Parcubacteria bacterium DG_74_2]|nr:MAG: hypothetical protein AMJ49_00300 [Parcubacteria bacterium DG_74_2]